MRLYDKGPRNREKWLNMAVIAVVVISFFIICHLGFLREDDWLMHNEAPSLSDVFRQTKMFYLTRGGRWLSVTFQYLFAGVLGEHKVWFDLVNTLFFALMLFVSGSLIQGGEKDIFRPVLGFTLLFWFLCPDPKETLFWIAGATTYLWAITLTLLFLAFFLKYKDESFNTPGKIGLFFLSVISASEFISCVSICGALVVYYLFHLKKLRRNAVPMVFGFAAGSLIVLLAPGNFSRAAWEGQSLMSKLGDLANHPLLEIVKYKSLWLLLIVLTLGWFKNKSVVKEWGKDNSILLLSLFWSIIAFSIVFRPLNRALFFSETLSLILFLKFLYECHDVFGCSSLNTLFESDNSIARNILVLLLSILFVVDASFAIIEVRKQRTGNERQMAILAKSGGIIALDRMVSRHRMAYVENFPEWTWKPLADHFGLDSVHVFPYFCQDKFYVQKDSILKDAYIEWEHVNDDSFGRQVRMIIRADIGEATESDIPATIKVNYLRPRKWYKLWLDKIRDYQYDRSSTFQCDHPEISFCGYNYYIVWIKRENAKHITNIELSMPTDLHNHAISCIFIPQSQ